MTREAVIVTALATWQDVLAVAEAGERLPAAVLDAARAFLADPAGWSARHGGEDAPAQP